MLAKRVSHTSSLPLIGCWQVIFSCWVSVTSSVNEQLSSRRGPVGHCQLENSHPRQWWFHPIVTYKHSPHKIRTCVNKLKAKDKGFPSFCSIVDLRAKSACLLSRLLGDSLEGKYENISHLKFCMNQSEIRIRSSCIIVLLLPYLTGCFFRKKLGCFFFGSLLIKHKVFRNNNSRFIETGENF